MGAENRLRTVPLLVRGFKEHLPGVHQFGAGAIGTVFCTSWLGCNSRKVAISFKSLGRPLNEPGFNGDLYITPDESYMIVSAKETKTYESELYISFRKPDLT